MNSDSNVDSLDKHFVSQSRYAFFASLGTFLELDITTLFVRN